MESIDELCSRLAGAVTALLAVLLVTNYIHNIRDEMGLMPKFKKGHTESHASKKNLIIRSSDTIYAYKMSHSLPAARHRITTQQTKAVNH